MIRITNIHILPTAPFPGTDFRLIRPGETGRPGDEYFDVKDGQWKPDPEIDDVTPYDPEIHAPARRKRGPVYKPYDMESIPLPLVVRAGRVRIVITAATPDKAENGVFKISYEKLLDTCTHDDGSPCGILVSDD